MPTPSFPLLIYGTVTNGENLRIIIQNDRTKEEITFITNASGKYLVDAANFASGYEDSPYDSVNLIIDELPQHTDNITTENGDIRLK